MLINIKQFPLRISNTFFQTLAVSPSGLFGYPYIPNISAHMNMKSIKLLKTVLVENTSSNQSYKLALN